MLHLLLVMVSYSDCEPLQGGPIWLFELILHMLLIEIVLESVEICPGRVVGKSLTATFLISTWC